MKTTTKTVDELIKTGKSPLPLKVIPSNMGINLCSVESLTWTKQEDGQLVSLIINFIKHECEFLDTISTDGYYHCKNRYCDIVTTWSPEVRKIKEEDSE